MNIAKKLASLISDAPNQYRGYFVPVFKISCDETPYHAGTAFGIKHNGKRYMVTAAHVLEQDECNPCDSKDELFITVNGSLTQLRQFEATTIHTSVQSQRSPVPLDLVLIAPSEFDLSAVFTNFFTKRHWYKSPLHDRLYVVACGYPATKNNAKKSVKTLSMRPYGYFGRISCASKCRKAGFDSRTHFCFDILLKKTFNGSQREVKAPKPHGISGGPVLVVHDFGRLNLMTPRLRGVVIENAWKQQCIVCVDIFAILSANSAAL
ncbi:hypothetical protein [Methylovorus glucosotrophus]|uniref:Peptidase S1 and S6 chymotrypsin/Hap n=1 Tax=Methylovorus glucosotrophus (strain SIP3-4) TaxID=582744 RepID=C6X8Z5_METGS|nr:hypothetical protein [Methylovorus glucosotrophus]ACT49615.1 hypothetical protein Msip34_0367 [Methylovorus glucosotrophus SIP3-4]